MTAFFKEGYVSGPHRYITRHDFYAANGFESLRPALYTESSGAGGAIRRLFAAVAMFLREIADKEKRLFILYSGGADSEVLIDVALRNGIPVVPVVVDLCGMNSYELKFAKDYLHSRQISEYLWIHVTEDELIEKWLPQLFCDCESLSFLLAGAYIGALSCPPGAAIVYSGENPDVICVDHGKAYVARHEYSFWSQKVAYSRGLKLYECYRHVGVISSYLSYPAILQRMNTHVPLSQWTVDFEYLSKDFIHNDPDFAHLARRFPQHGWEPRADSYSYRKMMVPGLYGNDRPRSVKPPIPSDVGFRRLLKFWSAPEGSVLRSSDLNRICYLSVGSISQDGVFSFHQEGEVHTTITNPDGQIAYSPFDEQSAEA